MRRVFKAVLTAIWFMALTLPVMGIKLNTLENSVTWRFDRILWLGAGVFVLAVIWDWCFSRKAKGLPLVALPEGLGAGLHLLAGRPRLKAGGLVVLALFMLVMPLVSSFYQTNIMISALLYVMLALGLNIVVGLAGQLVLGYVAFYAVGAYAYGLLYQFFGWGFWACLPVGGVMAVLFGLALGFPVLRLRGDYLAIVTLGFGEIVRLGLQNWTSLTGGPRGISEIPRPGFFGMEMDINTSTTYVYYLVLAAVVITIIVISRLKNSRVGLALQALREDEIAGEAMGITLGDRVTAEVQESAMILSMVVLGGMGSIAGVAIAAMILILAPEYLRAFSEYRMLIFGAIMVIMMIFRPQGLISGERRRYRISALHGAHNGGRS